MTAAAHDAHVAWIRDRLASRGIDPFSQADATAALVDESIDALSDPLTPLEREERFAALVAEVSGLGPIQPLLDDPTVEEIWINSSSRVFAARGGVAELTTVILTDQQVRDLVERMLHHSGRRLDLSQPFVDATLRGGERLHVVIPPVTGRHWSVNIRKHVQRARTLADLVDAGMVPRPMADFLKAAVASGLSVLVSGATQAGKTTLLRALAGELPRPRRVISCEEVFELGLTNWDCVALQTRPGNIEGRGEITLRDLVRETLRMRPECLIVGEVRGPEALDMLLALNAGVPGMATVHANSAREALDKLSILPLLAGENVTSGFVVPTLASSIDLVCHVERSPGGSRRLAEIIALPGRTEGSRIESSDLWSYDGTSVRRGPGGLDLHERFAAAGFDLSCLLAGDGS
ncbi:Flp pilus assembly complex ATPase component TadA [Actinomyces sp. B33]|uniref:CpaF family protein n=1 Tax=Actinomyces sp. B33 TaxID=2942131 RepID=UPI00234215DB|nr:ATPase, T2SS/T4P/T4SS family [Actinomyces sp. B33]MDC4233797.1 Flp pilus assembly complex ATPase component TadA [Actinomyces sp. B33]